MSRHHTVRSPQAGRSMASVFPLVLLVALAALAPALGQAGGNAPLDPLESKRAETLLGGLEERSRIIGLLLLEASRDYRRSAVERASAAQELSEVQAELDRETVRVRDLTLERLDVLRQQRDRVSARYREHDVICERLLGSIRDLLRERDALGRRIADLRALLPADEELISGVWEITWLPSGISGTFYLDQSGTLVSGQYRLGSIGTGSLRGTFVGSKLYLERVDSERGRDAELEGFLDADGSRIRGTWQALEMVQGGLPHGQWVARRVR